MANKIQDDFFYQFWTDIHEMISDLEEYGGWKVLEYNDEYITITGCDDDPEDEDEEILLYLGHANNTIWIEKVR